MYKFSARTWKCSLTFPPWAYCHCTSPLAPRRRLVSTRGKKPGTIVNGTFEKKTVSFFP